MAVPSATITQTITERPRPTPPTPPTPPPTVAPPTPAATPPPSTRATPPTPSTQVTPPPPPEVRSTPPPSPTPTKTIVKAPTVESILKDVHDHVIPNKGKVERARKIISKLVSTSDDTPSLLIQEMKACDELFMSMFKDVFFAGLFYDGLCDVNTSSQFKLYFVLNLPFMDELKLSDHKTDVADVLGITSGYSCLWSEQPSYKILPKTPPFADSTVITNFFEYTYTGYFWRTYYYMLVSSRVLMWFGNILSTAVSNIFVKKNSLFHRWFYNPEDLFYDIGVEELGDVSLQTYYKGLDVYLRVTNSSGSLINIQMVPVFSYKDELLVPKPQSHNTSLWRLSNIKAEKNIVTGGDCVEQCIRYLIKFCRMQGSTLEVLSSYHIKTLVLLHLKNNPWLAKDLPVLFMGSLRDLLECLARQKIAYYFDEEYNLLSGVDVQTLSVMKDRLTRILNDIHTRPTETLRKYFTMMECNTETIDGSDPWVCSVM